MTDIKVFNTTTGLRDLAADNLPTPMPDGLDDEAPEITAWCVTRSGIRPSA